MFLNFWAHVTALVKSTQPHESGRDSAANLKITFGTANIKIGCAIVAVAALFFNDPAQEVFFSALVPNVNIS